MSHGYLNKHNAALEFNNKSISLNPLNSVLCLDREQIQVSVKG